jgi:hypothetical protein
MKNFLLPKMWFRAEGYLAVFEERDEPQLTAICFRRLRRKMFELI